jgi:hypothetical protein
VGGSGFEETGTVVLSRECPETGTVKALP